MMVRLLSLVIGLGVTTVLPAADPPRRCNLLLVTADDMNADSVGWMGNRLNLTPNLDAFAKTAHRFVNNHNTCPICQPGRQALMTGRVPHRSGALGFNPINKDVPTLVEVFKAAGYFTAVIEKTPHMSPAEKFPWDFKLQGEDTGKNPIKMRAAVRDALAKAAEVGKPFFLNATSQTHTDRSSAPLAGMSRVRVRSTVSPR